MDRRAANTVFIKLFRQMVRAVAGAGEDQHLLPVARTANHLRQQFTFCVFIDKVRAASPALSRVAARRLISAGCVTAFRQAL